MQKDHYEPGALVLLRNVPMENTMSIERKTSDRYIGPYSIVRRTKGGSYVLQELNGNILRHTVAAYRLVPYIQRTDLEQLVQDADGSDSDLDVSEMSDHQSEGKEDADSAPSNSDSGTE